METSKFRLKTKGDKIILNPIIEEKSTNLSIKLQLNGNKTKIQTAYFKQFDDFIDRLSVDVHSMKTTEKNVNQIFQLFGELIQNYDDLIAKMLPSQIREEHSSAFDTAKRFVIDKIMSRDTSKKRLKIIESDECHVKPMKSGIGIAWKSKTTSGKGSTTDELVQTTYEYVSIVETMESNFKNNDFFESYFDFNEN